MKSNGTIIETKEQHPAPPHPLWSDWAGRNSITLLNTSTVYFLGFLAQLSDWAYVRMSGHLSGPIAHRPSSFWRNKGEGEGGWARARFAKANLFITSL